MYLSLASLLLRHACGARHAFWNWLPQHVGALQSLIASFCVFRLIVLAALRSLIGAAVN